MDEWGQRSFSSRFDELKSAQIIGFFLSKSGGQINYLKLIKLMYLAERKSFELYGRPLTGDEYYNLRHGQVLSTTLDLIKNNIPGTVFQKFFSKPRNYRISLISDPKDSELSRADIKILESIFDSYGNLNQWELRDICHELPEYEDPGNSRLPLSYEYLMKKLNFSDEEINQSLDYISHWSS